MNSNAIRPFFEAAKEELAPPPAVVVIDLPVEEITLTDVSPERQKAEYRQMLDPEDYDDYQESSPDEEDDDDSLPLNDDDDLEALITTNTFAYGFDPFELDADSGHRAFCNNFPDNE